MGSSAPRVSRHIQLAIERFCPMGVDLSDWATRLAADRESSWSGTGKSETNGTSSSQRRACNKMMGRRVKGNMNSTEIRNRTVESGEYKNHTENFLSALQ